MSSIKEGYFTVNGNNSTCTSSPYDTVQVACRVLFDFWYTGQQMKAELKVLLPDNTERSFFTGYQTVGLTNELLFTSDSLTTPITEGQYKTVWFVIYDSSGTIVAQGDGKGYGLCETITVTKCPKGQRYARGLFGDCDKGYYQCDELVTGYCCCGNVPPADYIPWNWIILGGAGLIIAGILIIPRSGGININMTKEKSSQEKEEEV